MNKESIAIDIGTQSMLQNLNQTIAEAKARIELILKVYLNAKGIKDGQYIISQDFGALILNPQADLLKGENPE